MGANVTQVAKGRPRTVLWVGPTLREALARGVKIKMTLESAEPKGKKRLGGKW